MSQDQVDKVDELLKGTYKFSYQYCASVAVKSKHKILYSSKISNSCQRVVVRLDTGIIVKIYAVYMPSENYGPYLLEKHPNIPFIILDLNEMTRRLEMGRIATCEEMKDDLKNAEKCPVFVFGDFNSPSDMDYKGQLRPYEWPTTKILRAHGGFTDSFREANPCPAQYPGHSWATIYKNIHENGTPGREPQDRIDFIFYKAGTTCRCVQSELFVDEYVEKPNIVEYNVWPSDHFAVISRFNMDVGKATTSSVRQSLVDGHSCLRCGQR
ncbi:unnamed protein product [Bursaphelenchus xylophilus]|uniref:(pine wood nematode) hypothetical protein n=1 Tax=Bursaphelenchus xylophilus TaxID=6326 RepID=A0A1I7RX68_BURXY|nr:unnamed protein product [Bursaphelenchus xylophilus]CAG9121370.1 unnamed protein product [Bursaphelenchus xylophilus]